MEDVVRQAGSDVAWANSTNLHPLGLAAVLVLGLAMLLLPRRHAVVPMFLLGCIIPSAQRLVIYSLDFDLLRIMVLFGWTRVLLRRETDGLRWQALDYLLLTWAVASTIAYTALQGDVAALVNRLGQSFDAIGMYFLFRFLIRDWADLLGAIKALMWIAIPVAFAFIVEQLTARNAFSIFGGVPGITLVRDDRLRCQGAFSHPILAGCFWASVLPLMAAAWWRRDVPKLLVMAGIIGTLAIIGACASSTPVMAVLFAGFGGAMFVLRGSMRLIRWGAVAVLFCLHMVMQAPVWHLMSRVDIVSGSTGWHRFNLVDQAIRRWDEWILMGTTSTAAWGHGLQDVTNHYVLEGVRGGGITLLVFVLIIATAFGCVGRTWRAYAHDRSLLYLSWAVGVSLFVHCCNFLAVSYFGQITMMWFFTLAVTASLAPARNLAPVFAGFQPARPMRTRRPVGAPAFDRLGAEPLRQDGFR